jgi:hypothetical protein
MKYKQRIIDNCESVEGLRSITTWCDLNSSATFKGRRATRTVFRTDFKFNSFSTKLHKPCDLISGSLYYLGHI